MTSETKLIDLASLYTPHLALQEVSEETKKMLALTAALRRICSPKQSSGKLEVSPEIYKQWKAGGTQRKMLLGVLLKCDGDKDLQILLGSKSKHDPYTLHYNLLRVT